jgi:hypothetical protein
MIWLMKELTASYGRYKWLEARSAIPAQRWANLYNMRQQPSAEQIVALGTLAPYLVEWMLTGHAGSLQIAQGDALRAAKQILWLEKREELEEEAKRMDLRLANELRKAKNE